MVIILHIFQLKLGWLAKKNVVHFSRTLLDQLGDWQFNSNRAFYMGLTQSSFLGSFNCVVFTHLVYKIWYQLFYSFNKVFKAKLLRQENMTTRDHLAQHGSNSPAYLLPAKKHVVGCQKSYLHTWNNLALLYYWIFFRLIHIFFFY